MKGKSWILFLLLAPLVGTVTAQDARTVLQAAATAMGATNLKSIQYSATGYMGAVGQTWGHQDDWPKFQLKSYTRTIDFDSRSSTEDLVRTQGNYLARGGGGTPIVGEQRQIFNVSGNYAWNGDNANPTPASNVLPAAIAAEVRQLEIWLTPHGFLKAAMAAGNATTVSRIEQGQRVTVVSFTALGKYRVNGVINDQNLVTRVQSWVPHPVLGDMLYETRYTQYKDFGGVKFPTNFHQHIGETVPWLLLHPYSVMTGPNAAGVNSFVVTVSDVRANVSNAALTVPDAVRQASAQPVRVESQKLADGVWFLAGGSHNSVAVEFSDFVTVVEAPQNEERSLAVIAEVRRLIPNKPIRYLVNTHHHFDHLGGVRTFAAEGVTLITHQNNRVYYEQVVINPTPRTLMPDRMSLVPRAGNIRPEYGTVDDAKYTLSDGTRTLDLYYVQGNPHVDGMVMAYLPKEKILIEADMFTPPAPNAPSPARPSPSAMHLFGDVKEKNLDISTIAPLHGRVVPFADFVKFVGKTN